jgi:hypothetical protein
LLRARDLTLEGGWHGIILNRRLGVLAGPVVDPPQKVPRMGIVGRALP